MVIAFLIIILTFLTFLTNFSSVEFAICSGIPFGKGSYHMESSLLICNINPWTGFCMVGDFSGGYSQTDCNFNVNVTVDSYMNSSINFSFSHLKDLLAFNFENTSKIMAQIKTIPQSLLFYLYLRNKHDMRLTHYLIAFVCLYSFTGSEDECTFTKLNVCKQIQFFTLDFIYICDELVSFHSTLLCLSLSSFQGR